MRATDASNCWLAAITLCLTLITSCSDNPDSRRVQPTSLIEAAEQGDLLVMDQFLKGRELVNMRNACQFTPLMQAALNGHYHAVKRLLDKGASVDLVDKGGYSALMLAASNNFHQIVELLLAHGANIDRVEHSHGWSALIWASKRGHIATVQTLLNHQPDFSIKDDQDKTALDYALANEDIKMIELLNAVSTH